VINNARKQIWLQFNNLSHCFFLTLEKVFIDEGFPSIKTPIIVHRLHSDTFVSNSVKFLDKCHTTQELLLCEFTKMCIQFLLVLKLWMIFTPISQKILIF